MKTLTTVLSTKGTMMGDRGHWARALTAALVVTAAAVLAGAAGPADAASDDGAGAVVQTESGPVRGTVASDHRTFQGIPFAAPPVGELRWRSPQRPEPWSQARDATKPGNRCAQGQSFTPPSTDEDCLYLNVTTPGTPRHGWLKPVMVWLHGGGNSLGSGSEYDTHRLAVGGDVVVVTVNYRLGVFGFFGHPQLASSGGFGLEDQQAALRWVQRNATSFGGDPGNVTLFGQSGGANDVCAQLTSPSAKGLFHRAIMQTGSCATSWPRNGVNYGATAGSPWLPLSQVEANGVALAAKRGCTDPETAVDCLRRVPVADLLSDTRSASGLTPVAFGNRILPESPDRALAAGRFNRMPVMSGTTRDEERLPVAFFPQPFSEQQYQQLLAEAFGDQAQRVAAQYPSSALGSPALAWAAVTTDRVWVCPQLADDRLLARQTSVHGFEFADRQAPTFFPFPPDLPAGAYHGSEMAYLFDLAYFAPKFTPEQQLLADLMIRYWSRFATTGDPNDRGLPNWPRFATSDVQSLAPGAGGIRPVNLAEEHNCGFWANLP